MSRAYYNEMDPHAAQWLRNLIVAGEIAPGIVDERDIRDVKPNDLAPYTQCHFFAGIGVWSYALRRAGVSDDTPVWTGSCPCQSFSNAGSQKGMADVRHLWPSWHYLIEQCRPNRIYGEQVKAAIEFGWIDLVYDDLEALNYAVASCAFSSAGVGAPHIRQRLWFVADAVRHRDRWKAEHQAQDEIRQPDGTVRRSTSDGMAYSLRPRRSTKQRDGEAGERKEKSDKSTRRSMSSIKLAIGDGQRRSSNSRSSWSRESETARSSESLRPGPLNGFWGDADWLACTDGKWRPVKPSLIPLAPKVCLRAGITQHLCGKKPRQNAQRLWKRD